MKKLLLGITVLFTSLSVNAGLFDTVMTGDWTTKKVDAKYKVETYGYDVRVYEWTPEANKNITCVFVAGSENSSGVACYPKKGKSK